MADPANPNSNERQQTDHSLLQERERTDAEISKRDRAVRGSSDAVVVGARERADEVLAEARSRADVVLEHEGLSAQQKICLRDGRAAEDAAVVAERDTADERLERELRDRNHALEALLVFEREQTDERLLIERSRGDASLLARDNFMGMVSHDLRNLLGAMALTLDRQARHSSPDEAGQENLRTTHKLQRLTARINRLVGDLMDVTSIESGKFAVTPALQDARTVLREAQEAFAGAASARGITFQPGVDSGPLMAKLDHDRIFQVLANIVGNALKFTPDGGSVSLRARPDEGQLRISVSDSGPGIPEDQLERIFERFWQVDQADRRGLGLGLFISKCIVESHGGKIWADSRPGEGSTFHFTLPASPSTPH